MFKIGDKVWRASHGTAEKKVLCPECFGKTYLTVILGDDSRVNIPCVACSRRDQYSYEEYSTGYVYYYEWFSKPELLEITGIEINPGNIEYRSHTGTGSWYSLKEEDIFLTEEEAKVRANELSAQHNQEELEKINRKEKHNRTWAWNLHYHRDCIKRAERDLAYHKSKFEVAKLRSKEEKDLSLARRTEEEK